MTIAVAIISILTFLLVFWAARVIPAAATAISTATEAMRTLASKDLDDEAKEVATRKAAITLLGCAASIAIRSTISVIGAGVPIYGADALGLTPASETIDFLSRWDVIVVSSVVLTGLFLVGRRLWPTN